MTLLVAGLGFRIPTLETAVDSDSTTGETR